MIRLVLLVLSIVLMVNYSSLKAYEHATHGAITNQAFNNSILNNADFQLELGLPDEVEPFGSSYYDISDTIVNVRLESDFEAGIIKNNLNINPLSLSGWLMRGAIREDDWIGIDSIICTEIAANPQDDPYPNPPDRPLNHFYDPANDRPLEILFSERGQKAPNWATGSTDAFTTPNTEDINRRNHFTIFDAREAYWRALTGRNKAGVVVADTDDKRKAYWATTFRALGDIVHLVEDMAQPQHTRNDAHSGACSKIFGAGAIAGEESIYEKYIENRARGAIRKNALGVDEPYPTLNYAGYPIPEFDDYASYFSTRHLDGVDPLARRGLADFSNREFFSVGTNIDAGSYTLPSTNTADYNIVDAPVSYTTPPNLPNKLLTAKVIDTLNPGYTKYSQPLTTESVWYGGNFNYSLPIYSLTYDNYDAMANILIPRAVAYSAGTINRFFRGRLELEVTAYSDTSVSAKFRNMEDNETLHGQDSQNILSQLMLTYEYDDGIGNKIFGTADNPVNMTASDQVLSLDWSTSSYTFSLTGGNAIPAGAQDLKLRLAFRGRLGNEDDAIAVGMVDMTSSGFIFTPDLTPTDGLSGSRLIEKMDGIWALNTNNGYQAGNIDWKGWYVDGKPTVVLSWDGPRSRSLPNFLDDKPFTSNIYKDGVLYAVAPSSVLGAALMKDSLEQEWLVAICSNGLSDIVYRKPNILDTSSALYDPVLAPNDWQEIGNFSFPHDESESAFTGIEADLPWFFKGDGTEAQTMRFIYDPMGYGGTPTYYRPRYKINILENVASFNNLDYVIGSKIPIGIDYVDNKEVLLEMDTASWLLVNGKELLSNKLLGSRLWFFGNDPGWGEFSNGASYSPLGLTVADYHLDNTNGVYIYIYYLDLRTRVLGITVSLTPTGANTNGSHYIVSPGDIVRAEQTWENGPNIAPSYSYRMAANNDWPTTLGTYGYSTNFYNNGFITQVIPDCGAERSGKTFCSNENTIGILNYFEGNSDPAGLIGYPGATTGYRNIGIK